MKKYKKLTRKINKRVRANNASMLSWLILPVFTLFFVTNYFFQKPKTETQVLGLNTKVSQIPDDSIDSKESIKQKFKDFNWNGQGVVSIVFTGAHKNQYDLAYKELAKRNLSASVSVPTQDVDLDGTMTWLNIRFLQFKGWEIVSQSKNQICEKDSLKSSAIIDDEVRGSKEILSNLGLEVNLYLSPCGIITPELSKSVNQNYKGLIKFGIEPNRINSPKTYDLIARQVDNTINANDIEKWIKATKANRSWLILSFPEISDKKDINSINFDLFVKTLDQITQSKMQVVVPGEIIKYDK